MFGFGKVPCVLCDQQSARGQHRRVRDRKGYVVCHGCYEKWDRSGRSCERCGTPVHGGQEVGLFMDGRRALGHADCGASLLAV